MKCLIKKTHKVKYYFKYKNKYYGVGSKKCVKKLKEKIKNKDINVKKVKLNKSQRNNLINLNKKKSNKKRNIKGGAFLNIATTILVEKIFEKITTKINIFFRDFNNKDDSDFNNKDDSDLKKILNGIKTAPEECIKVNKKIAVKLVKLYNYTISEISLLLDDTTYLETNIKEYAKEWGMSDELFGAEENQAKINEIKKLLEEKIKENIYSIFNNNLEQIITNFKITQFLDYFEKIFIMNDESIETLLVEERADNYETKKKLSKLFSFFEKEFIINKYVNKKYKLENLYKLKLRENAGEKTGIFRWNIDRLQFEICKNLLYKLFDEMKKIQQNTSTVMGFMGRGEFINKAIRNIKITDKVIDVFIKVFEVRSERINLHKFIKMSVCILKYYESQEYIKNYKLEGYIIARTAGKELISSRKLLINKLIYDYYIKYMETDNYTDNYIECLTEYSKALKEEELDKKNN